MAKKAPRKIKKTRNTEIEEVGDKIRLENCFCKRKKGLINSAIKLNIKCSKNVYLVIENGKKLIEYASKETFRKNFTINHAYTKSKKITCVSNKFFRNEKETKMRTSQRKHKQNDTGRGNIINFAVDLQKKIFAATKKGKYHKTHFNQDQISTQKHKNINRRKKSLKKQRMKNGEADTLSDSKFETLSD